MRLKEARARKLFSLSDLAQVSGVSRANLAALEAGKWLPSLRTVRRLIAALGVAPGDVEEFAAAIAKTSGKSG